MGKPVEGRKVIASTGINLQLVFVFPSQKTTCTRRECPAEKCETQLGPITCPG
jgi:hypothetical protein